MRWVYLGASIGLLAITIVVDRMFNQLAFFEEWPPEWSGPFLIRTIALACSAFLLLLSTRAVFSTSTTDAEPRVVPDSSPRAVTIASFFGILFAVAFAGLVSFSPNLLAQLAEEDHLVEWTSALLAFAAGLLTLLAALQRYRNGANKRNWVELFSLVFLAGTFILLGLEEVSWFQRVFDLPTPSLFDNNRQKEINLHNFATVTAANAYFVAATIFCVVLPYLFAGRVLPTWLRSFTLVMPPRSVLYGSVFAAAITYKMWNVIPIQMTFWLGLCALWTDRMSFGPKYLRQISVIVMCITLLAFQFFGHRMGRSLDAEVREFIIPYGFFLYSLAMVGNAARDPETLIT